MITQVLVKNIGVITGELNRILKRYLKNLSLNTKYGLFSIGKEGNILINTALASDLLISYIYRQLQYGYPPCWETIRKQGGCKESKEAKLEFTYVMASVLDELFTSIKTKRQLLKSSLQAILENKDSFSLLESIKVFLSWFLENYKEKYKEEEKRAREIVEKLDSLDDEYVEEMIHQLIDGIDKRDKWIDKIIKDKLKIRGFDKHVNSALDEQDIDKLIKTLLIGLAFDGFTWLKPLIYELAALYVYIYNDYRILPFGPMQHVIEGGYTWSLTLGDFIDPETNSLMDVKSSSYATNTRYLVRMNVELRMPIHVVVPHYKKVGGQPDTSKIYLSVYRLRYKFGRRPNLEEVKPPLYAEVPGRLLKVRNRIKSLTIY